MEKTFKGTANRVGTIFENVDQNTIEMANVILRLGYPNCTLIHFADPDNQPDAPAQNDCYLVSATGTVWGVAVEKDDVLRWTGAEWEILEHKITGLNTAITNTFGFSEMTHAYGIQYDVTNSDPGVTRIGNMALHSILPVHNKMRGCVLADNGTVAYYLNATNWNLKTDGTPANLDGTDGQVMVEIPQFFWKFETDGNIRRVMVSEVMLPGYTQVPKLYISAYEATVYRPTNKLASVANLTADYRGGNNSSTNDAAVNSLLGVPATSISRTNLRSYARARGAGWEMYTHLAHKIIFWLFVVEHATRNSQAPVNNTLTAEGYRQGGLGDGVTTAVSAEWSAFNGYYPFIRCGASDALGNFSGEVAVEITDFGGTGINRTFMVPRYRGVENPFGHIWKNTDGVNLRLYADGVLGFYNEPPASPTNGMRVIVGTTATGDFAGHENEVAQYSTTTSAWSFYSWNSTWENWIVYSTEDDKYYLNATGAGWVETTNTNAHTSDVFTTDDPAKFTDSDFTGYLFRGTMPRGSTYVQEVIFGNSGEFLPQTGDGNASLNFCDYFYTSLPTNGYNLRTLFLGGNAAAGALAGLGNAHTSYSPAFTSANLGSRLCFLPEAG